VTAYEDDIWLFILKSVNILAGSEEIGISITPFGRRAENGGRRGGKGRKGGGMWNERGRRRAEGREGKGKKRGRRTRRQ
jgi:hypothetical protein